MGFTHSFLSEGGIGDGVTSPELKQIERKFLIFYRVQFKGSSLFENFFSKNKKNVIILNNSIARGKSMKKTKLLSSILIASSIAINIAPIAVSADTSISNTSVTSDSTTLSTEQINKLNSYVQIENGKMILNIPSNSGLTTQQIEQAKQVIDQFNLQASNNGVIIDAGNSSQTASAPSFGVMRAKRYRYYTANGYEYRDSKGHWHYVVTKSPFEAAFGVALHGWEGALGGSWKSGHEK